MNKKLALSVALTMTFGTAVAQEDDSNWKTSVVVPGIHMFESDRGFAGGNLGLLVGDDGVVLIDDGMPTIPATTVAAWRPYRCKCSIHGYGCDCGCSRQAARSADPG